MWNFRSVKGFFLSGNTPTPYMNDGGWIIIGCLQFFTSKIDHHHFCRMEGGWEGWVGPMSKIFHMNLKLYKCGCFDIWRHSLQTYWHDSTLKHIHSWKLTVTLSKKKKCNSFLLTDTPSYFPNHLFKIPDFFTFSLI